MQLDEETQISVQLKCLQTVQDAKKKKQYLKKRVLKDLNTEVKNYFYNTLGLTVELKVILNNKFQFKHGYNYRASFVLYFKNKARFSCLVKLSKYYTFMNQPYLLLDMYTSN